MAITLTERNNTKHK